MDTRKIDSEIKMKQWIEIIRECRSSGQTVKSWCAEQGINQTSYYYWLRRIRTAACNTLPIKTEGAHQIVPLNMEELKPKITSSPQTAAIVIHINSAVVEIHNGASESAIENTLRVVKSLC